MNKEKKAGIDSRVEIFVMIVAVVMTVFMEFVILESIVKSNAENTATVMLDQVITILEKNELEEQELASSLNQDYIVDAKTVAYFLEKYPESSKDMESLTHLARVLQVDEIHLFDTTGTIFFGTVPSYYGYNFDSGDQIGFFKPMLKDKSLELCQDVMPNTAEGKSMMYALVWNQSRNMMVQVGVEPQRLLEQLKKNEISTVIGNMPVYEGYNINVFDAKSGKILGATDKSSLKKNISYLEGETQVTVEGIQLRAVVKNFGKYKVAVTYEDGGLNSSTLVSILIESIYLIITGILIVVFMRKLRKANREKDLQIENINNTNKIIASAGMGIWHVHQKEGMPECMNANEKARELLEISEEDISEEEIYKRWESGVAKESLEEIRKSLKQAKEEILESGNQTQNGKSFEKVYQWNSKKNGLRYYRNGGSVESLGNGDWLLGGYLIDVTETVREEYRKTNELNNAKFAAEAANKAKSSFLFNMSHDIRTPINAIMGFTDLLKKHHDDPVKRMDYLAKISDSSRVLLSIINNVLEMARIEKGLLEVNEAAWDINQICSSVGAIFQEMMKKKEIDFKVEVNIQHPYVYCDSTKLSEVLINLVSNAFKYTKSKGSVTLRVEEISSNAEEFAVFRTTVEDTGIGMSSDFIPKIFDEFSRESNTTANKIEGSGLGMSIVKKLVEFMKGEIEVSSEKGKGTKFTLKFGYKIADKKEYEDSLDLKISEETFKGKKVLLAEDNDLNAEISIAILEEVGFEVERAEDGLICVDRMKSDEGKNFDLILMDIQMPNMNGYDAAREIRMLSDAKKSSIPIIAMTANAFEEDRKNALNAGMNGHVSKPVSVKELLRTIAKILKASAEKS